MSEWLGAVVGFSLMLGMSGLAVWFAVWAWRGALTAMGM